MSAMALIGSIFSILLGMGATLCWMALIVAGMANSTPALEAALLRFFWGVAAGGSVCAIGAIAFLVFKRPGLAGALGAVPIVAFIGWMFWELARG